MFHNNLRSLRLKSGLSQKQLAEYLNISPQSVSKWEKGESQPSVNYLPKIAECFQCEINDFFATAETKTMDVEIINEFFTLKIDVIYNQTKEIEDVVDFVLAHPNITDDIIAICTDLKQYKTVRNRTIQGLFHCTEKNAQKFIEYLVNCEMLEKLDIDDTYFVVQDAVDGFIILLQSQETLCRVFSKDRQQSPK